MPVLAGLRGAEGRSASYWFYSRLPGLPLAPDLVHLKFGYGKL